MDFKQFEHLLGILACWSFCINQDTPIDPVFEAVYTEVDGPEKLQEYGTLNMKKNIDPEGLEKGVIDVKKLMKNQPFVSDGLL